jgi:phosphocarrier protein
MIERRVAIVNELGLHARAAARLVRTAGEYRSRVQLVKDGEEADAKSILSVLLLAAAKGTELKLRCEGPDEQQAIDAVSRLIAERFGEES